MSQLQTNNIAPSSLGFLGTGGMGGALYAALSTLATVDNDISAMELKNLAKAAKASSDITDTRLDTQIQSAEENEKSAFANADKEFASAGSALFGCIAGLGFSFKDFSSDSLKDEINDTQALQNELKPSDELIEQDENELLNVKAKQTDIKNQTDKIVADGQKAAAAKMNACKTPNEPTPEEQALMDDDAKILQKKIDKLEVKQKTLEARETSILNRIDARKASGSLNVQIQADSRTATAEEQVIDRMVGTDTRAPNVSGFKGNSEEEANLNRRAIALIKADPAKLRTVRNAADSRMKELLKRKEENNAQRFNAMTQIANQGSQIMSGSFSGTYEIDQAKYANEAAIDSAEVDSIKMAEEAFQAAVRGYEEASESSRSAAVQIAQGYQQAARG